MVVREAPLVSRGRHQVWACPTCERTLGEVYDGKVVVKAGERILVFSVRAQVQQHCPKCGTVSTPKQEQVA